MSLSHRHMLATTTFHQNKTYSKSIRQYALFPSAYLFIKITKYHQKIISHSGYVWNCHLTVQCQIHAKISCVKVQLTYIYKTTFLIFIDTYCWNLINILPQ